MYIYESMNVEKIHIHITYHIPGTPMTSIFEGQPPQNKAFSNQNKGHLGSRYMIDLFT